MSFKKGPAWAVIKDGDVFVAARGEAVGRDLRGIDFVHNGEAYRVKEIFGSRTLAAEWADELNGEW